MSQGWELLDEGLTLIKQKEYQRAEATLFAAMRWYESQPNRLIADGFDPCTTVLNALARVHRLTGRYEDAIATLELALPNPGAFKSLVSILRFLGKAASKEGDVAAHAEWYRRMYCIAMLYQTVHTIHSPVEPYGVDWRRARTWIEQVESECGSIYAYQFDGVEVSDDELLSNADYKTLRSQMK